MDNVLYEKGLTTLVLQILGMEYNIDLQQYLEKVSLEPYVAGYIPTEIGELLSAKMNARKVNVLLEKYGFQSKDDKGKWKPTAKGEVFVLKSYLGQCKDCIIIIDFKIKWKYEIVDILNGIIENEQMAGGQC